MEGFNLVIFLLVTVAVGYSIAQDDTEARSRPRVRYIRSCQQAGLCCEAVDNKCYVNNGRMENGQIGRCFCDSKCLDMGDCCDDFRTFCRARDCIMGNWTEWSKCSEDCGLGSQQRKRPILQKQKFGGQPCETATHQKRSCEGTEGCLQNSVENPRELLKEVGYIMPANFSIFRYHKDYNPMKDIRKNLFFKNLDSNIIPRTPGYCATYKVTHARKPCSNNPWAQVLEKGTEVCVECQPPSMVKNLERCRGQGVYQFETHWKAIEAKDCHGKWKMITKPKSCTCNVNGAYDFVLV